MTCNIATQHNNSRWLHRMDLLVASLSQRRTTTPVSPGTCPLRDEKQLTPATPGPDTQEQESDVKDQQADSDAIYDPEGQ
eukprot:scaffold120732_cov22-Tisochrysis_lutea.AAC.1